jgi:Amt family ammonium transporter
VAALALVNSQLAAAMGGMVWMVVDIARYGKASALGFASGFIAGLATVTPASGFVGPMGALAIGAAAGLACYGAVMLKGKLGYDDTLDAFGVHGVGGAVGTILLGVFALRVWNPGGADGLLAGNAAFFGKQLLAVGVGIGYAVVGTVVLLKVVVRWSACAWVPSRSTRAWTSTCTAKRATTWAWASPRRAALRSTPNR